MIKQHYELLIVGAGPAGLACATSAAESGVDVAVIDEQKQPGGLIYHNVGAVSAPLTDYLGKDYTRGRVLLERFQNSGAQAIQDASVWYLDEQLQTGILLDGESHFIDSQQLLLAGGAQERPMPVPGWQLPGVMTAGAGQILLKSAAMLPEDGVVLAGNGPLLLLLAWQYLNAGVRIQALVDTTPEGCFSKALGKLPAAWAASDYLLKGLRLKAAIKKAGVPVYKYASNLHIHGKTAIESLSFETPASGNNTQQRHLQTSVLMLHQGVIPNLRLPMAAGCQTRWDDLQQCWVAEVNEWGQSSVQQVMIAGDGARIGGGRVAELQGHLCGLQAACALGKLDAVERDQRARKIRKSLKRHLSIRPFLDQLYPPAPAYLLPGDDTLVCRCEEITAGQIREATRLGCTGPNQVKAFTRSGMGPCQGSQCASTVAALIADEQNMPPQEVGVYRVRPPLKPITLGQLADSQTSET